MKPAEYTGQSDMDRGGGLPRAWLGSWGSRLLSSLGPGPGPGAGAPAGAHCSGASVALQQDRSGAFPRANARVLLRTILRGILLLGRFAVLFPLLLPKLRLLYGLERTFGSSFSGLQL
jgi:hypothetical protein